MASIIAIDVMAILCVVAALSVGLATGGSGPRTRHRTHYDMLDGSIIIITRNSAIGKTIERTVVRPATVVGLCLVWWPAAAAATLTALALTSRGGRYIAEFQPPRMTLKRLMVAVAFLGADVGWSLRTLEPSRGGFLFGGWRPIPIVLFILHVQVFLAASIAILLYRARLRGGPVRRLVGGRRERMWPTARLPLWRSITLGALILLWIGISWLLVVSRGDPETFLRTTFAGYSRPDAFNALDRTMAYFWVAHSCLSLTALSATWSRRPDVLVVLLIGPAMALGLGVLSQRWSDTDWVVFVGVCLMGWLASTLVSLVYWGVRSRGISA